MNRRAETEMQGEQRTGSKTTPAHASRQPAPAPVAAELYLNLLKRVLTRTIAPDGLDATADQTASRIPRWLTRLGVRVLGRGRLARAVYGRERRARVEGRDRPRYAETMVGLERLDNIEQCVVSVIRDDVPGDLIETGVWRGGSVILMRALLAAYGDTSRVVWVADSFEGLPPPRPDRFPPDEGDWHHDDTPLAVSLEEVRSNFERYGLLDDQVKFLPGWFETSLPQAPIEQLAVLRLDGDMYESTIVALDALYEKLSVGGYVIVDDYALAACRQAVDDFRKTHGISERITKVDWTGVWWRREQ